MGLVYKAEDERLRRTVALKVLLPAFVGDPERRQRFLREARAAAAVTHPTIAAVYEVGEEGSDVFIAMEYVEGRTLRALLEDGPRPVAEAVALAVEIARALERAHASGVIHRDLKPENVMVDGEGRARILDFGLAKVRDEMGPPLSPALSQAETVAREADLLHPGRDGRGHRRLHVAGAGARPGGGRALGPLLAGGRAVRAPDRTKPVPRLDAGGHLERRAQGPSPPAGDWNTESPPPSTTSSPGSSPRNPGASRLRRASSLRELEGLLARLATVTCAARPRTALHRRPSLRGHEPPEGPGLFLRGARGRADRRPRSHRGPEGGGADLRLPVQGPGRRRAPHRPAARGGDRPRGKRAQGGQPPAHHRPARERGRRLPALVRALRARPGGRVRHPGRDHGDPRGHV